MPPPQQDSNVQTSSRQRPRANTSFIAWRRNVQPVPSTSSSLAASPAAPVQTLPIDALIQLLTPPAVPSPQHVRALVTSLSTQTPPPSPAVLMPILSNVCAVTAPPSLQTAGFDALAAYCSCGMPLLTSDRLIFFDLLQATATAPWSQEVWESRLKALNALILITEDAVGIEKQLPGVLSNWLRQALQEYCLSDVDGRQDKEHPVEVLSASLINWFSRFEASGRLDENDVVSFFEFYQGLVDYAIKLPRDPVSTSAPPTPTPLTPQRDTTTYARHRRHPSSLANIPPPQASANTPIVGSTPLRLPFQFVSTIYLNFLNSRMTRLPLSFLPVLMPLLFRILSAAMSPLPSLSPSIATRNALEHAVTKIVAGLLTGPYATKCRILLRQFLLPIPDADVDAQIRTSLGALRTLRQEIRTVLEDRMAMRAFQRGTAMSATHAGTPASVNVLDSDLMDRAQRAWTRNGAAVWDARKISFVLVKVIRSWNDDSLPSQKESIFEEVARLLNDVLQEMDDRLEDRDFASDKDFSDTDTGCAVGRTLQELMTYVQTLRTAEGIPILLPLSQPYTAPNAFLRAVAEIFRRKQSLTFVEPPASIILLSVVDHLYDADSERIPRLMTEQHQLKPSSTEWLDNWEKLLKSAHLFMQNRPRTRRAVIAALQAVFTLVRDMPAYRRPLMDRVFDFWTKIVTEKNEGADGEAIWRLLGDEAVVRAVDVFGTENGSAAVKSDAEGVNGEVMGEAILDEAVNRILGALATASTYCECNGELEIIKPPEASLASPVVPPTPSNTVISGVTSPAIQAIGADTQVSKDKETGGSQLWSLLSFSRHQTQSQAVPASGGDDIFLSSRVHTDRSPLLRASPEPMTAPTVCRGMTAVIALCEVFQKLAFIDSVMNEAQSRLSISVFGQLLRLLRTASCPRARIVVLQCLMRLRADRDHRVFLTRSPFEDEQQLLSLARLINRVREPTIPSTATDEFRIEDTSLERSRTLPVFERDGRRTSRGRTKRTSSGTTSRSRSRVPGRHAQQTAVVVKPRDQLWVEPDIVPFSLDNADKTSQLLITFDPTGPNDAIVFPVSDYMDELVEIIKTDRDWEVLSYVLVHLPTQLANKHFWCGPLARESIAKLLTELCQSIKASSLGKYIPQEEWPLLSKSRDAVGLAYHTLTVLISYHNIFDGSRRKALIDVLQMGLSGKGESVVVCMHALNLCAYEMESTMVKELPSILDKLKQIFSNPLVAVHILTFLGNINSLPSIYSNFTEADYKTVFAVALQYLQHHNRLETANEMPFSLSQHVRIMSYYVLYLWFLTLRLEDRQRHVPYIVRQLLVANNDDGRMHIDAQTEICLDFIARYTYANADPKPAPSLFADIITGGSATKVDSVQEKSWVMGYSVVTVRLLEKPGWMEITTRRPSGTIKFLMRAENVPLVGLGEVHPDMFTIPAGLMMDKDPRFLKSVLGNGVQPDGVDSSVDEGSPATNEDSLLFKRVFYQPGSEAGEEEDANRPDPVTGYVWSGTAPSQRRKRVDLHPSFFPLQFSPYPDTSAPSPRGRIIRDTRILASTIRALDRTPVIDTHKVGILYVAPGQTSEMDILRNVRGSSAYTRFLSGIGRLIKTRGQLDVYTGGLNPDEDGEFAYAWWDDTAQILYHTATMMPNHEDDPHSTSKKRHIGNDYVRIVWNDSGLPYRFDTLTTDYQFINIVIEPHSRGEIAAYSNNLHENEYFKLTVQCAEGMAEFAPIGDYKIVSARTLSIFVRQLSIVADWYASIFKDTKGDTEKNEIVTNWRSRLETIKKFANTVPSPFDNIPTADQGLMGLETSLDFTPGY